jgi:hypothetical protein
MTMPRARNSPLRNDRFQPVIILKAASAAAGAKRMALPNTKLSH